MCRLVRDTGSFQVSAAFKAICLCFGEDRDSAYMSSLSLIESHCIFKKLEIHKPPTPMPSFSNWHRLLYIRNYYHVSLNPRQVGFYNKGTKANTFIYRTLAMGITIFYLVSLSNLFFVSSLNLLQSYSLHLLQMLLYLLNLIFTIARFQ
jgi:hypothetical protein